MIYTMGDNMIVLPKEAAADDIARYDIGIIDAKARQMLVHPFDSEEFGFKIFDYIVTRESVTQDENMCSGVMETAYINYDGIGTETQDRIVLEFMKWASFVLWEINAHPIIKSRHELQREIPATYSIDSPWLNSKTALIGRPIMIDGEVARLIEFIGEGSMNVMMPNGDMRLIENYDMDKMKGKTVMSSLYWEVRKSPLKALGNVITRNNGTKTFFSFIKRKEDNFPNPEDILNGVAGFVEGQTLSSMASRYLKNEESMGNGMKKTAEWKEEMKSRYPSIGRIETGIYSDGCCIDVYPKHDPMCNKLTKKISQECKTSLDRYNIEADEPEIEFGYGKQTHMFQINIKDISNVDPSLYIIEDIVHNFVNYSKNNDSCSLTSFKTQVRKSKIIIIINHDEEEYKFDEEIKKDVFERLNTYKTKIDNCEFAYGCSEPSSHISKNVNAVPSLFSYINWKNNTTGYKFDASPVEIMP